MAESFTAATQEIFADLITKPKLTEKLLNRPPFRFIHDVVTNTMNSTGFPEGLFQGDELNGKLLKQKQDKIDWLTKLIQCIESVTKQSLNVNPNKVVAGLEAEYTNEMLQAFASVAIQVANGQLSMQDILSGMNAQPNDDNIDASNDPVNDSNNNNDVDKSGNANNSEHPNNENLPKQQPQPTQQVEPAKQPSPSPQPQAPKPAGTRSRPGSGRRATGSSSNETARASSTAIKENSANTEAWIIETQQTLGALIQRPRLLEKLLKRPPFRFLHDIIKSLIASTGYPLPFLDEEKDINQADIKDVKFKYQFALKLTIIISATINEDLSFIDAKNIISGKKPEDTNVLLTKLAKAATIYTESNVEDIKKRILTIQETQKRQKQQQQQAQKAKTPRSGRQDSSKKQSNGGRNSARPVMPKLALDQLQSDGTQKQQPSASQAPPNIQQPVQPQPFQAIQKLQRPRTARRAPPKLANNVMDGESKEPEIETNAIIVDQNENSNQNTTEHDELEDIEDLDDGAQSLGFIRNDDDVDMMNTATEQTQLNMEQMAMAEDDGDHGKLVRDILDAQSGIKLESTRLGTHRKDSAKSVEKLEDMKEMIQKLCQTCLPLGKCIDLVFQDVEAINSELLKWKQEIKQNRSKLVQEKESTKKSLDPLQKQLDDIKQQIVMQQQLILQKKAVLLRNEEKINDIIHKRMLNE